MTSPHADGASDHGSAGCAPAETVAALEKSAQREAVLTGPSDKLAEVWQQLSTVADPELDQSVTDMKFISALDIDTQDRVAVQFRLPTYWCAANFAFMMADDMRAAVSALPWVKTVSVVLDEHMYAGKINTGLAEGRSFQATFGDEADGDIDDVRKIFLRKAFQRRQEAMILHLRELGHTPDRLIAMTLGELDALNLDAAGATARARYHERRAVAGPASPGALVVVTPDGAALTIATLPAHLKALRSVRINAEFNGALCSGLLSARYEFDTASPLMTPQNRRAAAPNATPESQFST